MKLRNKEVSLPPIVLGLSVCGMAFVCYFLLVPEIQAGMNDPILESNFCIVLAKDRFNGCVMVKLVHAPSGEHCVYEVRRGVRTNYTGGSGQDAKQAYLDGYQDGLEYECYHPTEATAADMRFLTFFGPKTGNWIVYSCLVMLVLLLCCCASLHELLREPPRPSAQIVPGGGMDEETSRALFDNHRRVEDWEDQQRELEERTRKAQALLGAKVEREQEKRLEMSADMQRERAERLRADDDLKTELQDDLRRLEDLILTTVGKNPKGGKGGGGKHRLSREDVPRLFGEADAETRQRQAALDADRRAQQDYVAQKVLDKKARKLTSRGEKNKVLPVGGGQPSGSRV
mmetsp:Transcript_572/g.1806  ORF Transcript_572/g.1806 Transcript_572/m.1806 type:complete len:344 (+) Transcript_572:165-1196(+)